ncbi:dicarboxylate transporter 2.1, chloroplastic-like isoform X2 [Solanum stenotomum]|uniref:dicarboxylate transporter 2.1, chloroplastic-like isoform X2 n=1 Tax=Solanum stenotomum TaxID=172797 RepID=UPI0020D1DB4E|nr:dicarboxylate transporter 2.1, chloroplastic-like isoform X2 [Solanum stenotomum]XP_049403906.1 dicarboxylate transporter 2.1, chloroplastic-like isoform X2 [Solanum stenotomum]
MYLLETERANSSCRGSSFREISDPKMFCYELTVYTTHRIATYFVKWLGKSTPGLSYGLALSEALIAPAMPNTMARAGGVFLPIIKSLTFSWK